MKVMLVIFILCIVCMTCNPAAEINTVLEKFNKTSDLSTITVSLESYNVNNPDGEFIEIIHTILPNTQYKIIVTNVPYNAKFVVLQVHSYLVNVTLSYNKIISHDTSTTGTNIGLIKMNKIGGLSFYLTNNNSVETDVLIATQAYGLEAPVPGGCNMEFPVEISPFIQTTYNDDIIKVDFALASTALETFKNPKLYYSDECNRIPSPVEHRMYHKYFPELDFTRETYFQILRLMMTKGQILKNSMYVPEKISGSLVRRIFASYRGTGNAFVVIAQYLNESAVYVPSVTFPCNDIKEINTCLLLTTTFSKLLCSSLLFIGLFECFFGHSFFRTEIFFLGFFVSGVITYILISILFNDSMALSIAVSTGFFVACSMQVLLIFFGLPIVSVLLSTLSVGFLLASIILGVLVDYLNVLVLDINYWSLFIGLVVLCPILMLPLAEKANILACAFIGSYIAIISVDYYFGTNLRYIVLNTFRRATVDEFKLAQISLPFQWKDALLVFGWMFLMFSGISYQSLLLKHKPPYPPPINPIKKVFKRLRGPTKPSEVTPLLRETNYSGE